VGSAKESGEWIVVKKPFRRNFFSLKNYFLLSKKLFFLLKERVIYIEWGLQNKAVNE
jgi:hypothetical protein